MTNWLIKHFVKNYEDTSDSIVRNRYGQFAGIVGIICNIFLCFSKGAIGFLSGSVSIVADAVNNLSDASSNVLSLLGFKLASRPADPEHPYGHGRYEYLAGLIVAIVVVVIGFELIESSIEKIINPTQTTFNLTIVLVLLISILIKLWMAFFNSSVGKKISSETLRAAAIDSRNDVISTTAVLICAIISFYAEFNLDGWAGLAVGIFVIWSGIGLVKDTIDPLLGRAPDPDQVQHIHNKIMSYPGVLGTHDLMVHDYGPGAQFVSAHVEMSADVEPMESHDIIDNIEQDFKYEDGLIVTLHYDPIVTNDPAVNDLRHWVEEQARLIDESLSIHDLRTVLGKKHTNILFDCLIPVGSKIDEHTLIDQLTDLIHAKYPDAHCIITIDHGYVSSKQ